MRAAAFAAFFMSGASSLIFQSIWSRMLGKVFGASSIAISTTVTVFMAGLGLGAFFAGRYADRIKHPLISYGVVEAIVGVWALMVPFLVDPEVISCRFAAGVDDLGTLLQRLDPPDPLLGALVPVRSNRLGIHDLAVPVGAVHTDEPPSLREDAQVLGDLLAPPAVTQRDRNGALGLVLADDVVVQFLQDFAWCHRRLNNTLGIHD